MVADIDQSGVVHQVEVLDGDFVHGGAEHPFEFETQLGLVGVGRVELDRLLALSCLDACTNQLYSVDFLLSLRRLNSIFYRFPLIIFIYFF